MNFKNWMGRGFLILFWICFAIVITFPFLVDTATSRGMGLGVFYMFAAVSGYIAVCFGSAFFVERAPTLAQCGMILLGLMWGIFSLGMAWLSTNPDVM